jgi:hypothetical protein
MRRRTRRQVHQCRLSYQTAVKTLTARSNATLSDRRSQNPYKRKCVALNPQDFRSDHRYLA